MKKSVLFALAMTLTSALASATTVNCSLVRLTDNGGVLLASTAMNCSFKEFKSQNSSVGRVSFACTNDGKDIRVVARNEQTGETLSSGRTLSAQGSSQFATYYATVNDSLMVSCQN